MSEFSLEHFAPLQGKRFILHGEETGSLSAELIEAKPLATPGFQGRQPFTLLFKGPVSPVLPQSTYSVAHDSDSQALDIFLVPVSADASGACYEAVFS